MRPSKRLSSRASPAFHYEFDLLSFISTSPTISPEPDFATQMEYPTLLVRFMFRFLFQGWKHLLFVSNETEEFSISDPTTKRYGCQIKQCMHCVNSLTMKFNMDMMKNVHRKMLSLTFMTIDLINNFCFFACLDVHVTLKKA